MAVGGGFILGLLIRGAPWKLFVPLLVSLLAFYLIGVFYFSPQFSARTISMIGLMSSSGILLGFLFPGIWRKVIAPNILTILFYGLVGGAVWWATSHPFEAGGYSALLVGYLKIVVDNLMRTAVWTGEPMIAAIVMVGVTGLVWHILRNRAERWLGRWIGGDV